MAKPMTVADVRAMLNGEREQAAPKQTEPLEVETPQVPPTQQDAAESQRAVPKRTGSKP